MEAFICNETLFDDIVRSLTNNVVWGSNDVVDLLQNSDDLKKPKKAVVQAGHTISFVFWCKSCNTKIFFELLHTVYCYWDPFGSAEGTSDTLDATKQKTKKVHLDIAWWETKLNVPVAYRR